MSSTTTTTTPALADVASAPQSRAGRVRVRPRTSSSLVVALLELSKARLSALVLLTTAVGFVLAAPGFEWGVFLATMAGTTLAAFGANALNQCLEAECDARMERTRTRPLPSGRITLRSAYAFAAVSCVAGPLMLLVGVNGLAAGLASLCIAIYVLIYTPLKLRTPLNTLVGAVVGAIPPLIGWAAARGTLEPGAWVLAAILFVWQIPHFLALAWIYREDYERGGFRMLPVVDRDGGCTGQAVLLYALTLIPVSLMLTLVGVAGLVFALGAGVLGAAGVVLAVRLYQRRTRASARRVFLYSVIYLPLLLALMVADRGGVSGTDGAMAARSVQAEALAGEPISRVDNAG